MAWYYFDTRDDAEIVRDDLGIEVADFAAVKALATKGLAELALEVLPGLDERCLGIDVYDTERRPVLTTEIKFQAKVHAPV